MSGRVIPFPKPAVHLWLHPTKGGWVGVIAGSVDPFWPDARATFVPTTCTARDQAAALSSQRGLALHVHAEEF